jgi:putative FmdB family regulatory protein
MPTYDYECDGCGHRFEAFQTMSARAIRKCPKCGKNKARRLIGAGAAIIFKGSGFYQTDYRSESYKTAAANDKPASPPSAPATGAAAPAGASKDAPAKKPADSAATSGAGAKSKKKD